MADPRIDRIAARQAAQTAATRLTVTPLMADTAKMSDEQVGELTALFDVFVTVCLNGVESSVSSGASALTGNFLSSTLYLMSRAGSALYAAGRLAGFAVFPSYITNDQATLLATAA